LPDCYQNELAKVVTDEMKGRGARFAIDHVVAGLTFGFWVRLLTRRYDNILWQGGVSRSFPHVKKGVSRADMHDKSERLRTFRNKVAHHYAIFDRGPKAEYQNLTEIVETICPDTLWLMRQLANPDRVINARPRI
jgi:hypothetical protein